MVLTNLCCYIVLKIVFLFTIMDPFESIQIKLHQFTRKYYTSELIKGVILFFSFGFLYLFFILFLEHSLWFKPTSRTFLFYFFLGVEFFLLIRFIAFPFLKLIGLKKGITNLQSSKMIGRHFPEVQDKLLNVLQLKKNHLQSDLLNASIDQKSTELAAFSFSNAVDFKQNKKYLKYAVFPLFVWVGIVFTDSHSLFKQSFERVVNFKTAYVPPPPFSFYVSNPNLEVVQGKSITILVNIEGSERPKEAYIHFKSQQYYLKNTNKGAFVYTFTNVQNSFSFYLASGGIQSKSYQVKVIKTPTINNISLGLKYPNYLNRQNEQIDNCGNISVPEGTKVTWTVDAIQTDSIAFTTSANKSFFKNYTQQRFAYSKIVKRDLNYQISSSNNYLQDFEKLQFQVEVVKDASPSIYVETNSTSTTQDTAEFIGQISDDYGISSFQIVAHEEGDPKKEQKLNLQINKNNIQTFYYQFPNGFNLKEGIGYQFFFQVFDNDAINGSKRTMSKSFTFRKKTSEEIQQELLQNQRNAIDNMQRLSKNQQQIQQELNLIQNEVQTKKRLGWSDKNKFEKILERQQKYSKMMQRQTTKLEETFDKKEPLNEEFKSKKEAIQQRLEELKNAQKKEALLREIEKIAEKLNKNDLLKKAKELAQQNQQQERSLTRILELTKRFYIEQKTMQIANKIENLSQKQQEEINKKTPLIGDQNKISEEFKKIKEELKQLNKDNINLKDPMQLPDLGEEEKAIDSSLNEAEMKLLNENFSGAKASQKKASNKLKSMSVKMEQAMQQMQGESMEENLDDLRKILENLVIFSFKQEQLINTFTDRSTVHPDFGEDLKKQYQLKTYFKHIDDSLYVLSMRLPKLSETINNDLSTTHYNLDQSLDNFSENRFSKGTSNQRYVMMAVNNLANYLSSTLSNMKNAMSMKSGSGKKKKSPGFRLPDLIKSQGELTKRMKQGLKKGFQREGDQPGNKGKNSKKGDGSKNEQGNNNGTGDALDEELYEIYKQQSFLRQALQDQFKKASNKKGGAGAPARKALKSMEDLENEILEKGFHFSTLQKMQRLSYDLLKLNDASLDQGKDNQRTSKTSDTRLQKNKIKAIKFQKQFYNQTEILNRQSLPLRQNYKKKVRAYFSDTKNN